jgi:hypothetical protein
LALNRLRLLPGAVERGQQERDQDRDDPDDDEQFDQGEAEAGTLTSHGKLLTEARRTSTKTWLRRPHEGASVDGMVRAGERRCETRNAEAELGFARCPHGIKPPPET